MNKKILLFLIFLFVPFTIYGLEINVELIKNWEGNVYDYFYSLVPTDDNGFVSVGELNPKGMPYKALHDAAIVKFDEEGNKLWSKIHGGTNYEYFNSVKVVSDGFIAVGSFYSTNLVELPNNGGQDAMIVKFDNEGNVLWQKNFGGENDDKYFDIIQVGEDFIAVGYSNSKNIDGLSNLGSFDCIVVKYDKEGNILWKKNFGGSSSEEFNNIYQIDNGFVVLGITKSTDIDDFPGVVEQDAIILKYDNEGNLLWKKRWGGNLNEQITSISKTTDDGYILVGYTTSTDINDLLNAGNQDAIIIKYDKDGNILWQKYFGGTNDEKFVHVNQTEDEGYVLFGETNSIDIDGIEIETESDVVIVKYDKNGNLLWYKNWGGSGYEKVIDVLKISNEEFILLLDSNSTDIEGLTKGNSNVIFTKLNLKYDVEVKTSSNGVSIIEQVGNTRIIKPTANEGYEVDKILIKDKLGNILDVEVTALEDGTYSFELYDDVIVEVLFKATLVNPKTGVSSMLGFIFTLLLIAISGFFIVRNYENRYEF